MPNLLDCNGPLLRCISVIGMDTRASNNLPCALNPCAQCNCGDSGIESRIYRSSFSFIPILRNTSAIPRDYLSDTPPIARYGVFGVSTWPIGCNTLSPLPSVSPLESIRSGGAIPPPQKGYLSDTCVETFRGATEPFQPDLPFWPRLPPNTSSQT